MSVSRKFITSQIHAAIYPAIIFLCGFSVFAISTWNNTFVWDDVGFIFEWPQIRSLSVDNVVKYFQGNVPVGQEGVYRPVRSIFYAVSFAIFGINAWGYHILASLVHGLISLMVFLLLRELLKHPQTALIGGLVFAFHPIHVEAVAWITASFDTMGFGLAITATFLWVKSEFGKKLGVYLLALFVGTMAVFANEMALTLPGLWLITWLFMHQTNLSTKLLAKKILWLQPLFLIIAIYCGIRFLLLGIVGREDAYLFNDFGKTMLTMAVALLKYTQLLFIPWPLTINHQVLPGVTGLHYHDYYRGNDIFIPSLGSLTIILSLVLLLIICFQCWKLRFKIPELWFGWSWVVISLIPVMQLVPQSIIFAERFLYIPSVGFSLLVSGVWYRMYRSQNKIVCWIFITTVISVYSVLLWQYATKWRDGLTFWHYQSEQSPPSALIYSDLGREYATRDQYQEAEKWLEKAYAVNPRNVLAVSNLGAVYALLHKYEQSLKLQQEALSIMPNYASALVNNAETYFNMGNYAQASHYYQQYLVFKPDDVGALIRLGKSFHAMFIYNQAEHFYQKALLIDNDNIDALLGLGNVYKDWGRLELAKQQFSQLQKLHPQETFFESKLIEIDQLLHNNPNSLEIAY